MPPDPEMPDPQPRDVPVGRAVDVGGLQSPLHSARYGHDALERARLAAYADYDDMDLQMPEFNRALDVASECATSNDRGDPAFRNVAKDDDKRVKEVCEALTSRCDLRASSKPFCRSGLKYGDAFGENVPNRDSLIVGFIPRAAFTMYREVDRGGLTTGFYQKMPEEAGTNRIDFVPGQIIHMRVNPEWGGRYGNGMGRAGRFVFRYFVMMSDSVVVNRLTRAVQRYGFELDVGDMSTADAMEFEDEVAVRLARETVVDDQGRLNLRSRAMADSENIIFPTRRPGVGGIKVLEGSQTVSRVEDVRFFYRRLLTFIPVPPAFLGIEDEVNSKSTLSFQDIQFARYLRALQQQTLSPAYTRLMRLQLAMLGFDLEPDTVEVRFPRVSILDEQVRAQTLKLQAEVAKILKVDLGFPIDFVIDHVLGLPDQVSEELKVYFETHEAPVAPTPTVIAGPLAGARVGAEVAEVLAARTQNLSLVAEGLRFLGEELRRDRAAPAPYKDGGGV